MNEQLRTVKITIEIDTTKQTLRESFEAMSDAVEWWNQQSYDFGLPWYYEVEPEERKTDKCVEFVSAAHRDDEIAELKALLRFAADKAESELYYTPEKARIEEILKP